MSEKFNRKQLLLIPMKYGLIASVISFVLILVFFYMGRHPFLIPPFLDARILIFLIFIYFAIREYKLNYNNGYLHLWEGLIIGVVLYSTTALVGATAVRIFAEMDPSFLTEYIELNEEAMLGAKDQLINGEQKVKITEDEFNRQMDQLRQSQPGTLAFDYFLKTVLIGFFIPLVYSVLFRRVDR